MVHFKLNFMVYELYLYKAVIKKSSQAERKHKRRKAGNLKELDNEFIIKQKF